jgi:hypothetical protein
MPVAVSVQVVNNVYFEFTMLFLILLSSLELCFATVLVQPGSVEHHVLHAMDIFFTAAFILEVKTAGCPEADVHNMVVPKTCT